MVWLIVSIVWIAFYLITHISALILIIKGFLDKITPREIYCYTEHSRIVSFLIWVFYLIIIPIITITYSAISLVKLVKWRKEYKERYE